MADLGPHSPDSCSSSLVPYEAEEDSNPEEDQNQQEVTPDQMEIEDPATAEAPVKKGMGIEVGPGEYQPTPPRYMRAPMSPKRGQPPCKVPEKRRCSPSATGKKTLQER